MEKTCIRCEASLPTGHFHRNRAAADGLQSVCKTCDTARKKADRLTWTGERRRYVADRNRESRKKRGRWIPGEKYPGFTHADYDRLLAQQGGGCAICGRLPKKRPLDVDHNHETGEVRGLLCRSCNVAIGLLAEDPDRLRLAIAYLLRFGGRA